VKILTISHFFEGHGGGIERVAAHLNREFSRSGHQAAWAASGTDDTSVGFATIALKCFDPAEKLTGLPMPIPGLRAIRALARAVRAHDAVIVHDSLYFTSIVGAVLAKMSGRPLILIQHIAEIGFKSRALRGLMRLANLLVTRPMIAAANHRIFISDLVRRALMGEPARQKSLLLHNGVDTSIFFPNTEASRALIRSRYAIVTGGRVLIFVGRFVEKKGLAILREIATKRPDLHFLLIGRGPIDPGFWGLSNVRVLGSQPQQVIAELYRAADILLLPSVGEGFPLVVQEAMASGLPVVCGSDSAQADPNASQWLRGIDIDLRDIETSSGRCCAAIDQLLHFPIDTTAMARYAGNNYRWSHMAEEIVKCLSP
jgi:alpha-maltose-1-phosphate synthase